MIRYAFRRHGFPTRLVAFAGKHPYPNLAIRVVFPSRDLSWTISDHDQGHLIFEHTSHLFETFPVLHASQRARIPVFDFELGGEERERLNAVSHR